VAEAAALGASIATVHAAGGEAMLRACNHGYLLVLGVTVLTSLSERICCGWLRRQRDRQRRPSGETRTGRRTARRRRIAAGDRADSRGVRNELRHPYAGHSPEGTDAAISEEMTPGEAVRAGAIHRRGAAHHEYGRPEVNRIEDR
jgi:hypothetical protein